VPSFVWMSIYLKKDIHPEPRYLIVRVFFMGIIVAPLAVAGQWLMSSLLSYVSPEFSLSNSPGFFIVAAFIEEYVKFLAVKYAVLNNPNFDEPVDAMVYMIIAALGFAAIENILVLFQSFEHGVTATIQIWVLRFFGATLLHALSSAIVGYFLAMSWFYSHHSKKLVIIGLAIATLFHATFNIIILTSGDNPYSMAYMLCLLLSMAGLISVLFARVKKRLSTPTFSQ